MNWEETFHNILNTLINWATNTGVKILIALVVMFISFKIINLVGRKLEKAGDKKKADKTVMKTLAYAVKLCCKIIVVVCLIGYLGIDTSGITALIASFGVCIGLAVNGALANLAGGVLILLTRPFRVDDFIEAQGISGTVADIHITNTKIITPDNKVIYVPNGSLANGNIINYSEKDTRRVDLAFSISVASDADKAKELVSAAFAAHPLVLKDKDAFVRINTQAGAAPQITARAWVNNSDYWTVYFDVIETVKAEFGKNGIEVPRQQLDVNVKNN